MSSLQIRIKDLGLGRVLRDLKSSLKSVEARAGYLQGVTAEQQEKDSKITLAHLAAVHEFGATVQHPGGTLIKFDEEKGARFLKSTEKNWAKADTITAAHAITIPARPFLRPAFEQNKDSWAVFFARVLGRIVDGKVTTDKGVTDVAMKMARDARRYVLAGSNVQPPDSPATIRRKGSERPLVDSGQLVRGLMGVAVLDGKSTGETT